MKLYSVTAEIEYVIAVEDDEDEHAAAEDVWREVKYDSDPAIWVGHEIKTLKQLPPGWDGMCIPYNGDGNTRIQEIVSE